MTRVSPSQWAMESPSCELNAGPWAARPAPWAVGLFILSNGFAALSIILISTGYSPIWAGGRRAARTSRSCRAPAGDGGNRAVAPLASMSAYSRRTANHTSQRHLFMTQRPAPRHSAARRRAALMAAAAIASGSPALADPTWTTNAIVVGRQPGSPILFSDSQHQTLAASLPNGSGAGFNTAPGPADHEQTIMNTAASVAPGRIVLSAFTFVGSGQVLDHTLTAGIAGVAGADQLTISSTQGAGRLVTLHKTIGIQTINNFVTAGGTDNLGNFESIASAKLQISGTGIGPGSFGADIFDLTTQAFGRDFTVRDHRIPDSAIDFTFDFILGQSQDLFLSALLSTSTDLDDRDGSFFGSEFVEKNYALTWLDGGSLTDTLTGAAVCGVSSQSASGFNYLTSIASNPCQPGGGGGGSAVPEPANWALMILGLGFAGTALRRQRAKQPALA